MIVTKICCYFASVVTKICYVKVIKWLLLEINFVVDYIMIEMECVIKWLIVEINYVIGHKI